MWASPIILSFIEANLSRGGRLFCAETAVKDRRQIRNAVILFIIFLILVFQRYINLIDNEPHIGDSLF